MRFHYSILAGAMCLTTAQAFHVPSAITPGRTASTALFGKSRKARRMSQKESKGRSQQFYKAMEEAAKEKKEGKGFGDDEIDNSTTTKASGAAPPPKKKSPVEEENDPRAAYLADAQKRYEERPELSTMIVDEETGIEVIQQGQSVLDVVTRKAVKLSEWIF
jgi:hypothetical protein